MLILATASFNALPPLRINALYPAISMLLESGWGRGFEIPCD